jgi:hypothetical protein
MNFRRTALLTITGALALAAVGTADAGTARFQNCKAFNARYPHGVGKIGAHDHTSSGSDPVTNFKRSNRLYLANRGLVKDPGFLGGSDARRCPGGRRCSSDGQTEEVLR